MKKYKKIVWILPLFLVVGFWLLNPNTDRPNPMAKTSKKIWEDPSRFWTEETQAREIDPSVGGFEVSPETLLDDYLTWAEYPPNSRPLLESHVDILNPLVIPVSTQDIPYMEEGKILNSAYSCNLQPERHTVTEGKSLRIFLSCFKTGSAKREKLKLLESELSGKAGSKKLFPPSIDGNDSGIDGDETKGDFLYTYHFRPQKSDWGDYFLKANFTIESDPKRKTYSLSHHFFSSPVAPARFTGRIEDYVSEGSLFVEVELEVKEAGRYTVEANLLTETEEPIAYARVNQKCSPGKQKLTLLFFGRTITKRRENGPYQIQFLRGELNTDVIQEELLTQPPKEVEKILNTIQDDRPKRKTMPAWEESLWTKAYQLSEFKDDVYDSEEKRNRIAELRALRP